MNIFVRTKHVLAELVAALGVVLIITIMMTGTVFADGFAIESTYPETGATNTTKENMCVKVNFTAEVGNDASRSANKNAFKITDSKGKEVPSVIYYNKKDPKYALIHIDTTKVPQSGKNAIKDDAEYICTITKDFQDNNGNTLGQDTVVKFTTMNQGRGMIVYMVLMVGMLVIMGVFTVMQSRKQMQQAEADDGDETFNPYKEAKKTGKSVEQVIQEHEGKGKKSGIAALLSGGSGSKTEEEEEELPEGHYAVKRPHPISEAGSKYKTGRKAKAEAEAKKKAAAKAKRKAEGYGKKKKK